MKENLIMSRTHKHEYTTTLFQRGTSNKHKSLTKEFKELKRGWMIASARGLLDRRDYESDRLNGWRNAMNGKRRANQKRILEREIKDYYEENN